MSSRRALKAAQAIREVVSTAILLEIKDPRVKDVTVTMVEVSGDIRSAKVYVSVMGDTAKQELSLRGLQSSVGYLQKRVGARIDTRYIPRLNFVLDKGAKNAMEVTRILKEVLPPKPPEVDPADEEQVVEGLEPNLESLDATVAVPEASTASESVEPEPAAPQDTESLESKE